jgi:hypothetical protein
MNACPSCGSTERSSAWSPSGFTHRCARCDATLESPAPPQLRAGEKPDALRGYVPRRMLEQQEQPAPSAQPPAAAKPARSPAAAPALTPATMLRLAKQRHRELKREIARDAKALAAKQREFSNISNVLDAAEAPKPRAVVRPIRTTA